MANASPAKTHQPYRKDAPGVNGAEAEVARRGLVAAIIPSSLKTGPNLSRAAMTCPDCGTANDATAESCFRCGKALFGLTQGAVLNDRYEILEPLGRGGMGIVYKAHDRELDEVVAVKVLRPDVAGSSDVTRRFRSEIKLARKVRHPNVCGIHEYGQTGHLRYFVMEYVTGVDLKRVIREKGAFSAREAYDIGIHVAEGLGAIHDAGIVHRDLKTPNIMRDIQGGIRLMDFGIAKRFEGGDVTEATATGHIIGTPEYMSPEQARSEKVDTRSDIYAFGVVLFELLTGEVPFKGDTPFATLMKHVEEPPRLEDSRIPPDVVPILRRALAKAKEERFASARELASALRAARARASGSVTTTPAPGRSGQSAGVPLPATQRDGSAGPTVLVGRASSPATASRRRRPGVSFAVALSLATGLAFWSVKRWSAPSGDEAGRPASRQTSPVPRLSLPTSAPPSAPAAEHAGAGLESHPPELGASPTLRQGPPPSSLPRATPRVRPTPGPALEGFVKLVVTPWAEVSADGTVVGTTPLRPFPLGPGDHLLRFRHPDYSPFQKKVTVKPGETILIEVDLTQEAFRR